jgi:predicted MFS family arabinose efflux permease
VSSGPGESKPKLAPFGQLLLLASATWAATYVRYTTGPVQEAMHHSLSITDNQMAVLQGSAVAVSMVIGAIPVGLLADRISRKNMVLAASAGALVALLLCARASDYNGLLLARFLLGLSIAGMLVPSYAMAGDWVGPTYRGRATMVLTLGETLGSPAAFALGGVLLVWVGLDHWARALLWMSVPMFAVLALTTAIREPVRREVSVARLPLRSILSLLWKHRRVAVPLQVGRATLFIADGAVLAWAAPLFTRKFHLSADRIGYTMGMALLIAGFAGPLLGGPLVDVCQRHGGPRRAIVCIAALAAVSVPIGLFALASSAFWAASLLAVFIALGFTISAAALALTLIVIPGELRALNVGVSLIVGSVFFIALAPLAVSGLSGVLGGEGALPQALAIVCASASLVNAIYFASGARHFPTASFKEG